MITWLLFLPAVALFMAINIIIGCYVAIRLGYGPPDWKIALNLVVRVTTLQDRLNAGRDWLDQKAPWADKFLNRLHIPKPIIIVEVPEEEEISETANEQTEGATDAPAVDTPAVDAPATDSAPVANAPATGSAPVADASAAGTAPVAKPQA